MEFCNAQKDLFGADQDDNRDDPDLLRSQGDFQDPLGKPESRLSSRKGCSIFQGDGGMGASFARFFEPHNL